MPTPTGEPQTPHSDDPAASRPPTELPDPPDQAGRTTDATTANDDPFVAFLKQHFPWMLAHPGRWRDRRPNPAYELIGLSREDAYQNAILRLLQWHRRHSASDQLKPGFVGRSVRNAITDLWRKSTGERRILAQWASDPTRGAGEPDDPIEEQLRAAVLEHRWHLSEPHQQLVDAIFDPAAPTQKAIAERVDRSQGWVSDAIDDIANTVRQCLVDGKCPRKE